MQNDDKADMTGTPAGNRVRISFFGRRNAGKSTLINALTGQPVAIVSAVAGTTTDPVSKAMEILPLGPCLVTDTAGLDDEGELGAMRVEKSLAVLAVTDIAVWVEGADEDAASDPLADDFRRRCAARGVPVLVQRRTDTAEALKARLAATAPSDRPPPLLADLVRPGDTVVCVCPIDESAPKGRLILPQQQAVRELLDCGCAAVVCQPAQLAGVVAALGAANVRFAVTDSQAFAEVDRTLPAEVPLTSFSILFARQKGDLAAYCAGARAMAGLKDGDTVLISEGCTHHRQCNDIGTVKLPRWLGRYTGKKLNFAFSSGGDFPLPPPDAPRAARGTLPALVIHCGGCMLTRRAVMARLEAARAAGVPVVNYGVAIALMHGIVADPATCMVTRAPRG